MESMDTLGTSQQYQSLLALCPSFPFFSQETDLVIVCLSPQSSETYLFVPSPQSSQSPHREMAAGVPAIVSVEALCSPKACRPHLLLSMAVFRPVCLPLSGTFPGTASKRACPSRALTSFPEHGPHWPFLSCYLFFLFLVSLAHWPGGFQWAETTSALFSVVSPDLDGVPFVVAAQ